MKDQGTRNTYGCATLAELKLLKSVPKRGTKAWDARELLRMGLGNRMLSFGPCDLGAHTAMDVKLRIEDAEAYVSANHYGC